MPAGAWKRGTAARSRVMRQSLGSGEAPPTKPRPPVPLPEPLPEPLPLVLPPPPAADGARVGPVAVAMSTRYATKSAPGEGANPPRPPAAGEAAPATAPAPAPAPALAAAAATARMTVASTASRRRLSRATPSACRKEEELPSRQQRANMRSTTASRRGSMGSTAAGAADEDEPAPAPAPAPRLPAPPRATAALCTRAEAYSSMHRATMVSTYSERPSTSNSGPAARARRTASGYASRW